MQACTYRLQARTYPLQASHPRPRLDVAEVTVDDLAENVVVVGIGVFVGVSARLRVTEETHDLLTRRDVIVRCVYNTANKVRPRTCHTIMYTATRYVVETLKIM